MIHCAHWTVATLMLAARFATIGHRKILIRLRFKALGSMRNGVWTRIGWLMVIKQWSVSTLNWLQDDDNDTLALIITEQALCS